MCFCRADAAELVKSCTIDIKTCVLERNLHQNACRTAYLEVKLDSNACELELERAVATVRYADELPSF